MIDLFRRKNYPKFWKDHLEKVNGKKTYANFDAIRFVTIDTETTGFDYNKDRILCIGGVAVKNNKILISDSFEVYIKQDVFNKETVKIHGIRRNGEETKISEKEALEKFIEFLDDAVIVAHHTSFDVGMINTALKRLKLGPLESRQLDTNYLHKKIDGTNPYKKLYSLDDLCEIYNVKKHDRHTAQGDALITAYIFLKILAKYKKNKALNLRDLLISNYQLSR